MSLPLWLKAGETGILCAAWRLLVLSEVFRTLFLLLSLLGVALCYAAGADCRGLLVGVLEKSRVCAAPLINVTIVVPPSSVWGISYAWLFRIYCHSCSTRISEKRFLLSFLPKKDRTGFCQALSCGGMHRPSRAPPQAAGLLSTTPCGFGPLPGEIVQGFKLFVVSNTEPGGPAAPATTCGRHRARGFGAVGTCRRA